MKKITSILIGIMLIMALAIPAQANTIYPDPNSVAEDLKEEQIKDEQALKESQQQQQAQPAQQQQQQQQTTQKKTQQQTTQQNQNASQNNSTTTAKTEEEKKKEEEAKKKAEEEKKKQEEEAKKKAEEEKKREEEEEKVTDFSKVLDSLNEEVEDDIIEKLEEVDTLEVKLKADGTNVLSQDAADQLRQMHKTLIISMFDELDRPAYQYEISTNSLKAQDYNLAADIKHDTSGDTEKISYTTPFTTGTLSVWESPNTEYVINDGGEDKTLMSDAEGKLSVPLTATTVSYHEKTEEKSMIPIIAGIAAGLVVLGAIIALIAKKIKKKGSELPEEETDDAVEIAEETEAPEAEPEKESEKKAEEKEEDDEKSEEDEVNEDASDDIDEMYEKAEKEEAERRASIEGDL